jgi:hypothetical protein
MRRLALLVVCAGLVLGGCAGSKTQSGGSSSGSDMPDFVLNPPKQTGFVFGTGIAEQASPQLAKETADLRARKEIATVLSSKVSSMLKDFLGQAGVGTTAEVTELSNSVTRSISEVELVGVTIEKRDYKGGKMYSLGKYPLDDSFKKMVNTSVNNALTSKEALLSQFRAKQGFDDLDKQLDKMKASEQ